MRIEQIQLHNFKKFSDSTFQFSPHFTVIIGDNATGKTSILDSLAILLSSYFIDSNIKVGQMQFKKEQIKFIPIEKHGQLFLQRQENPFISAKGLVQQQAIQWQRKAGDRGAKAKSIIEIAKHDREKTSQGADNDLPIILYYGTGRLWSTARTVDTALPSDRETAYQSCLEPRSDEKLFHAWFKQLTLGAIQRNTSIPALKAVQNAIVECIPNAEDIYFDLIVNQIIIKFDQRTIAPLSDLSDGYRNMISMVADIAHRAARLNPHLGEHAASLSHGIVLIDEIDLHLHPKWQRTIIDSLKKTFKNIQFIATTHSPFIVQSLESGEVIDLNQNNIIEVSSENAGPSPTHSYSHKPIEDICEQVMGVTIPQRSAKYQRMYDTAQQYYQLLKQEVPASLKEQQQLKQKLDELSAPFSDNIAYHAFLEMERMAAGINDFTNYDEDDDEDDDEIEIEEEL